MVFLDGNKTSGIVQLSLLCIYKIKKKDTKPKKRWILYMKEFEIEKSLDRAIYI